MGAVCNTITSNGEKWVTYYSFHVDNYSLIRIVNGVVMCVCLFDCTNFVTYGNSVELTFYLLIDNQNKSGTDMRVRMYIVQSQAHLHLFIVIKS